MPCRTRGGLLTSVDGRFAHRYRNDTVGSAAPVHRCDQAYPRADAPGFENFGSISDGVRVLFFRNRSFETKMERRREGKRGHTEDGRA